MSQNIQVKKQTENCFSCSYTDCKCDFSTVILNFLCFSLLFFPLIFLLFFYHQCKTKTKTSSSFPVLKLIINLQLRDVIILLAKVFVYVFRKHFEILMCEKIERLEIANENPDRSEARGQHKQSTSEPAYFGINCISLEKP